MSGSTAKLMNVDHAPVEVINPDGASNVILVCEHASNYFPPAFHELGLDETARQSHAAWDPGALEVAKILSGKLDATLIASRVSRLIYDCNRPPDSPDAMPAQSEIFEIPGNVGLSRAERSRRTTHYYEPFRDTLAPFAARTNAPVILVTIHSFTPIFLGRQRAVEIGVLHDTDTRLADEILRIAPAHSQLNFRRNEPYDATDGVTHTLKVHGIANNHLNVMLEIRNDLISTKSQRAEISQLVADVLNNAINAVDASNPAEIRI